jgi:hypothetical protein
MTTYSVVLTAFSDETLPLAPTVKVIKKIVEHRKCEYLTARKLVNILKEGKPLTVSYRVTEDCAENTLEEFIKLGCCGHIQVDGGFEQPMVEQFCFQHAYGKVKRYSFVKYCEKYSLTAGAIQEMITRFNRALGTDFNKGNYYSLSAEGKPWIEGTQ